VIVEVTEPELSGSDITVNNAAAQPTTGEHILSEAVIADKRRRWG
jgi:hypothetical protein